MAKKKHRKKHNFKYTDQTSAQTSATPNTEVKPTVAPTVPAQPTKPSKTQSVAGLGDFAYVSQDLRRIYVLAIGFTVGQLLLWYLFTHTGLGHEVYGLFKL